MYDLPMRGGFDASSNKDATRFAVELTHNGGTGARPGKDGLSVTAFPSGVYGSQVEVTESTSPLLVRRRELRPDSAVPVNFVVASVKSSKLKTVSTCHSTFSAPWIGSSTRHGVVSAVTTAPADTWR